MYKDFTDVTAKSALRCQVFQIRCDACCGQSKD
jgi:hypothetical protein